MGTKGIAISKDDWTKEFGKSYSLKMLKKLSSLISSERDGRIVLSPYTHSYQMKDSISARICEVLDFVSEDERIQII